MSSWFRTYRPSQVSQLHLTSVRTQLLGMMERGTLPSVWLLTGPKGTGKTSTSRILAALVNDPANRAVVRHRFFGEPAPSQLKLHEPDPSNELVARINSGSSSAVLEMDAASHRGIDDVRALKEQLYIPPSEGEVRVYILDEVHMLTTEAFNALLKVLEEPPPHAMFILATTERHKLPETVVSRATLLQFSQANPAELVSSLSHILEAEKITFEAEALEKIAQQSQGSFRDAVKLAEQVAGTTGSITAATVTQVLSPNLESNVQAFCEAVVTKNPTEVTLILQELRQRQIEPGFFGKQLLEYLYHQLLQEIGLADGKAKWPLRVCHFLLHEFQTVPVQRGELIPLLGFELKALDIIFRAQDKERQNSGNSSGGTSGTPKVVTPVQPKVAPKTVKAAVSTQSEVITSSEVVTDLVTANVIPVSDPEEILDIMPSPEVWASGPEVLVSDNLVLPDSGDSSVLLSKWQEFVDGVKERNATVAAILGSARPILGERGQALIQVYYKFHKEQLQQPKFLRLLQDSVEQVVGNSVALEFIVTTPPLAVANSGTSVSTSDIVGVTMEALS